MHQEPTLFEISSPGREGFSLPETQTPEVNPAEVIPQNYLRKEKAKLPEVSEFDAVRHFTRLSQWNFSIDTAFYPLGSCTMKYNPRINEEVVRLPGFALTHPYQEEEFMQGNLELMYHLQNYLCEIAGMDACTLQPAAGAHGELTGLLMIRSYHEDRGNPRKKIIIPDSAHGTNPASAAICGYQVVTMKTDKDGILHADALAPLLDEEVACLMVTNPSTIGLFEKNIQKIADRLHAKGALLYCDGANMNALMGMARVGDMGVDCMHYNLHKTFTTPHGGGGPGSGPVVVKKILEPYLPTPTIVKQGDKYHLETQCPKSIGRVRAFFGNFGMFVRAYTYIRELGPDGVKKVAQLAVLNANYLRSRLKDLLPLAYEAPSMHEVIFSDKFLKGTEIKTLDIAKRLLDYGFHAPTVYFPLIVPGSLMIEPTETENKATLDQFVEALRTIVHEVTANPTLLKEAPHNTPVRRLDETRAVMKPKLRA
ncbi:MAG TPA: aminomethyl-transferring glycine dehydrogenase subunit GcvPB [Deltaproteobacteria bacterium]|nr:MAG: glycine dehydrogenase (aminomethyl-transferring) [Deltaproteobacteria bacterium GWA2_45_12]HBF14002.1 aminomethyl-transferring glycine dehydrogenase subunit GcvPB [Deltaproteobacteria bacterium]